MIEEEYKDYKKWNHGVKQHLIAEEGKTILDAAKYMKAHLEYFRISDLTFNIYDIRKVQGAFIILLVKKNHNPNFPRSVEIPLDD